MQNRNRYVSAQETRALITREKLLKSAIALVNKHGMKHLTVRNICEEAGLSTGSFYNLFSGKDELVAYYLKYAFYSYKEEALAEAEQYNTVEKVLLIYRFYLACCKDAGIEFVSGVYSANTNPIFNFLSRDNEDELVLGIVHDYLEQGKKKGEIVEDVSTDTMCLRIATIVTGTIFYWCVFDGKLDVSYETEELLKTYLLSICVDPEYVISLEPLTHSGVFCREGD